MSRNRATSGQSKVNQFHIQLFKRKHSKTTTPNINQQGMRHHKKHSVLNSAGGCFDRVEGSGHDMKVETSLNWCTICCIGKPRDAFALGVEFGRGLE